MNFEKKLDSLIQLMNIPIDEKWENTFGKDVYNHYVYWRKLRLISTQEAVEISENYAPLRSNPKIVRYFKNIDGYFPPEQYQDDVVVEIGSGFGHLTLWFILSGASKVVSIGDPERIEHIQKWYDAAVAKGILPANRLDTKGEFVKIEDSTLKKDLGENSVAMVVMNDCLEHISPRLHPNLLKAAMYNLKPGGKYISRQHNTDCPSIKALLIPYWNKVEKEIFIPRCKKLIEERFPWISKKNKEILAIHTRGLDKIDLEAAFERYSLMGVVPEGTSKLPSIDPLDDVPEEGDTGVIRILNDMIGAGFKRSSVYPAMLDSRRSRFLQGIAKVLPNLFLSLHIFDQCTVFEGVK